MKATLCWGLTRDNEITLTPTQYFTDCHLAVFVSVFPQSMEIPRTGARLCGGELPPLPRCTFAEAFTMMDALLPGLLQGNGGDCATLSTSEDRSHGILFFTLKAHLTRDAVIDLRQQLLALENNLLAKAGNTTTGD